jgi:4-hydroxy-3-polyprenylbenzoate decarboxylase
MADRTYPDADMGAAIASGSFPTMGMVAAPCSVHSLAEIAHSTTDGLLTRAADVCLKERRRLVLLFGETPIHAGHIWAMAGSNGKWCDRIPARANLLQVADIVDLLPDACWICSG